ncbi:hypothetical protein HPB49_018006 [Dermacentor silvarum]|uniref:Uncharacterized protein n=1 Tax=Dermacentor silvarum TaxID=543639 RepID=A0ACB8DEY6_DERSI|nr:hypothetical protein HPB49_018006 [Dermacentor silvarum]
MDVQSQSEDLYRTTFRASDWTTILRAYKGGKPSSETLVVPPRGAPVRAKPPASAVGTPADATPATFKPTYRTQQQQLRVTYAVALRSKQLASLPPDTIRVVCRPRGGLALNGAMVQPIMQALQVTATDRDLREFHLRIHPTNNTFPVATPHEPTALHLVQLKEVVLQETSYPVAAYIAPPPAAARGVISQTYWAETPEQMLRDLQTRNPEADIIAARKMGRTLSILITFAHGPVPHTIRYTSIVYRCIPCKESPDADRNCRRPGHRYDVCPTPRVVPARGAHLTGTGSCKARNATAKRHNPLPEKTNSLPRSTFPRLARPSRLPLYMSFQGCQDEHHDLPGPGSEGSARRGRASQGSPLYPPPPPPPSSSSTPPDQPPQKNRKPDESPVQPIDLEAKFQDLAPNLEAKFTECITAQSHLQHPSFVPPPFNMAHPRGHNSFQIIQWLCKGFRRKCDPLQQIIANSLSPPDIIAIQDANVCRKLRGYAVTPSDSTDLLQVVTYVCNSLHYTVHDITSPIAHTFIEILPRTPAQSPLFILNCHLLPRQPIHLLRPLLQSVTLMAGSNPILVAGDFNCAHVDWGYRRTNHRGTVLYNEMLVLHRTI